MKEQDVAEQLLSYRDALGKCARTPIRRRSSRRLLALAPVAAGIACTVGVLVWPRDATAATLRQLGFAISNARSMDSHMSFQNDNGKWIHVFRLSNEMGRWRMEGVEVEHPVTAIYRDGLLYEDYPSMPQATVRPMSAKTADMPKEGEALEIVKEQLTQHFAKGAAMSLAASPPVKGHATYRVVFVRPERQRRVEIVVDKETNLPIYADTWSTGTPSQHGHWDYQFNVSFPKGFFELKPGRKLVDLRQTIPAFEATHKPLASVKGFQILDACSTPDGTVWLAARSTWGDKTEWAPDELDGLPGARYTRGGGIVLDTKLDSHSEIRIYGFAPLDPVSKTPSRCSVDIREILTSQPVSPTSDDMTAGQFLDSAGKFSLPVRSEESNIPKYFNELGVEESLSDLPFFRDLSKASMLENCGRHIEAAQIYLRFAKESGPHTGGYFSWMRNAADCYRHAGRTAEAARLDAEVAAAKRSAKP